MTTSKVENWKNDLLNWFELPRVIADVTASKKRVAEQGRTGMWEKEDIYFFDVYRGLPYLVIKHPRFLNNNGYVGIPPQYQKILLIDNINCHGGLTASWELKTKRSNLRVIGFDTAHSIDYVPGLPMAPYFDDSPYRSMEYVKDECKKIIQQIIAGHKHVQ